MVEKENKELNSYHIFMFPFKWDYKPQNKDLDSLNFSDRTDLKKIKQIFKQNGWQEKFFDVNSTSTGVSGELPNYNEYNYFYEEVRKAIYNNDAENSSTIYLEPETEYQKYEITVEKDVAYELDIAGIAVRLYNTGVGILSYHLENNKYEDKASILQINQYGRRIYAPFKPVEKAKKKVLADKIEIKSGDENETIIEKYSSEDEDDSQCGIQRSSQIITDLFGKQFEFEERFKIENNNQKEELVLVSPIIDDRMFVASWYGNSELASKVCKYNQIKSQYTYPNNDYWYKYVFVDDTGMKNCQDQLMTKKLLKKSTYERWRGLNTLYGMSRYSFVMLTQEYRDLEKYNAIYLINHMKTMYYQLVVLALMQRASILRFSNEASYIAQELNKNSNNTEVHKIRKLNEEYIRFINRMYFREVTAQEQGIELYNQLRDVMKIDQEAKDLDNEIDELHDHATLLEENKRNSLLFAITIVGALFAIPNFVTSFFGMNLKKFHIANEGYSGILVNNGPIDFVAKLFSPEFELVRNWFGVYFSIPAVVIFLGWRAYENSLLPKSFDLLSINDSSDNLIINISRYIVKWLLAVVVFLVIIIPIISLFL